MRTLKPAAAVSSAVPLAGFDRAQGRVGGYLTRATIAGIAAAVLAGCGSAPLVLCKAGSGELALRPGCQSSDVQLDLADMVQAVPCPPDSVKVGPICVDKFEASVWSIPADNATLIDKVKLGEATLADLIDSATQLDTSDACDCRPDCKPDDRNSNCRKCDPGPLFPPNFPVNGNWTPPLSLYAVSISGVLPTACVSWLQAEQACALSGKRLLTSQEWQRAAAGSPDGAPCNVSRKTGNPACVSKWGACDMVGNVWEWVGDWTDMALNGDNCTSWASGFGSATGNSCVGGPGGAGYYALPGARHRGGGSASPGIFTISDGDAPRGRGAPDYTNRAIGFRCAR